jgi:hypothetical protein
MKKKIVIAFFAALIPAAGFSQNNHPGNDRTYKTNATQKKAVPPWATAHHYDATAHAYFPDYYTYYDPGRGGYVFWQNGKYTFTPALPPFLEKVDLRNERIKILKGLSLDMHPELNYPYYMNLYPAVHNYNMVPVPIITNPAR